MRPVHGVEVVEPVNRHGDRDAEGPAAAPGVRRVRQRSPLPLSVGVGELLRRDVLNPLASELVGPFHRRVHLVFGREIALQVGVTPRQPRRDPAPGTPGRRSSPGTGRGFFDGDRLRLGNRRGSIVLHAKVFDGLQPGVVVVESIWPNGAFEEGIGVNALTSADAGPPKGGAVFHDTAIWIRKA